MPGYAAQPRLHLIEARTLRGLSQQQVADRIGTTHVNVSRWERGVTKPNPYFRRKLCRLFGKGEQELDLDLGAGLQEAVDEVAVSPLTRTSRNAVYDSAIPLQPAISLVGRDEELARIRKRLCAGGSIALTALNGLPGVGKTALSIALAHDAKIRKHFRDGIVWAGLGPHPNIPGLLSRWGTLLGLSSTEMSALGNNEEWAETLRNAIGSRYMLVVIDDAWRIEDALTFKVGGPHCAHLLTTRFPSIATALTVDGATVIRELGEEESMTLLQLLAPEVVDREEKKAHDLVQAVGGLPLALTLIGNYLRQQSHNGQSRRIQAALKRLSDVEERLQISEPHGPTEKHTSLPIDTSLSLQSVIAVTARQLQEQARTALYALAVFPAKPNSFAEEAALAVAGCTTDTLDALSDAGLLESTSSGRYTLHQTIADYARIHLQGHTAYDRLIAYIIDYIEAHKKDYELLELESGTIFAALEAAYDLQRQAESVRGVIAFAPFLLARGFYAQAKQHLQRAHEAAVELGDSHGIASVLLYLGEIAQNQGEYAQAESYYHDGLQQAHQMGDEERLSALLANLGWVTWRRGKYVQAEEYLKEGLALAQQIGHREHISNLLKILGSVVGSQGRYVQAEAYLLEGLTIALQIGDREQICTLLINLGVTAGEQGNYTQAEGYFQQGLTLARQIGHREQLCALLINLGEIADEEGDDAQAEAYFQEGLTLARQLGHREWISILLISLGSSAQRQGNYTRAEAYLHEGLDLARQIGRPRIICNALYEYGNLYLNLHQIAAAEAMFQETLNLLPEGDQELLARVRYGLARIAAIRSNIHEARYLGQASLTIFEAIGRRRAKEVRVWLEELED